MSPAPPVSSPPRMLLLPDWLLELLMLDKGLSWAAASSILWLSLLGLLSHLLLKAIGFFHRYYITCQRLRCFPEPPRYNWFLGHLGMVGDTPGHGAWLTGGRERGREREGGLQPHSEEGGTGEQWSHSTASMHSARQSHMVWIIPRPSFLCRAWVYPAHLKGSLGRSHSRTWTLRGSPFAGGGGSGGG